mmetsp:Transcript_32360/g.75121  ORF Transcript_32360/g.75121 Transcript_32360/m.75121 type:complete len:433 (-) Transcript_32360:8-1306(-)
MSLLVRVLRIWRAVFACPSRVTGWLDLRWAWAWVDLSSNDLPGEEGSPWIAGSGRARKALGPWASPPVFGGRQLTVVELASFSPRASLTELFHANFSHKRAFVLRGLVAGWPAAGSWTWRQLVDPRGDYAAFHHSLLPALDRGFPPTRSGRVGEAVFLDGLLQQLPFSTDCPVATVSGHDGQESGLLGENFIPRLRRAWRKALAEAQEAGLVRPDHKAADTIHAYLIFGAAGSGGTLHSDPDGTAFWNALVHGRKRWMFLQPAALGALAAAAVKVGGVVVQNILRLAHNQTQKLKQVTASKLRKLLQHIPAAEWFGSLMPLLADAGITFPHEEATVSSGDLIYGPPGVLHIVLALEDSIGCSEQLVDAGNLERFIRNEEEDYDPIDAFLACAAGRVHWPELLRPLEAFCARASAELKAVASEELKAVGAEEL